MYLFDMRLIESNLYQQAIANRGEEQPIDALYKIDKCLPLTACQRGAERFVPMSYFKFLKEHKQLQT